jgi:hypothetical protein
MFKSTRYVVLLISTFVCVQSAFAQVYFFNKLEMATGKSPQSLAVGDFNKDGMPDFAVANTADNTVSVFRFSTQSRNSRSKVLRPCPGATSVLSRPIEQKTIPVGLTLQDILNQKIPADEAGKDVIFRLLGGGRQSFAGFSVVALVH